jgi:predicted CXXCH cytochrome family protein
MPQASLRPHLALFVALLLSGAGAALSFSGDTGPHGDCANCHGSGGGASRATSGCDACHATELRKVQWAAVKPVLDQPAGHSAIACVACHDPHSAGTRFLRVPENAEPSGGAPHDDATRLCLGCHEGLDRSAGRNGHFVQHPVGILPRREEATGGIAAISLPLARRATVAGGVEQVIGCTTCHVPHSGVHPFLLRWSREEQIDACGGCHRDVIEPPPAPVIAGQ